MAPSPPPRTMGEYIERSSRVLKSLQQVFDAFETQRSSESNTPGKGAGLRALSEEAVGDRNRVCPPAGEEVSRYFVGAFRCHGSSNTVKDTIVEPRDDVERITQLNVGDPDGDGGETCSTASPKISWLVPKAPVIEIHSGKPNQVLSSSPRDPEILLQCSDALVIGNITKKEENIMNAKAKMDDSDSGTHAPNQDTPNNKSTQEDYLTVDMIRYDSSGRQREIEALRKRIAQMESKEWVFNQEIHKVVLDRYYRRLLTIERQSLSFSSGAGDYCRLGGGEHDGMSPEVKHALLQGYRVDSSVMRRVDVDDGYNLDSIHPKEACVSTREVSISCLPTDGWECKPRPLSNPNSLEAHRGPFPTQEPDMQLQAEASGDRWDLITPPFLSHPPIPMQIKPGQLTMCIAAVRLQRMWRGFRARQGYHDKLASLYAHQHNQQLLEAARLELQNWWRGRLARKVYLEQLEKLRLAVSFRVHHEKVQYVDEHDKDPRTASFRKVKHPHPPAREGEVGAVPTMEAVANLRRQQVKVLDTQPLSETVSNMLTPVVEHSSCWTSEGYTPSSRTRTLLFQGMSSNLVSPLSTSRGGCHHSECSSIHNETEEAADNKGLSKLYSIPHAIAGDARAAAQLRSIQKKVAARVVISALRRNDKTVVEDLRSMIETLCKPPLARHELTMCKEKTAVNPRLPISAFPFED
ncbi:unnamed protein product [Phytomonas sp. Hart1]|nr:unnamed protein product [Phytomonas sp. Hart1]|eukprot:CCW67802.1 unnamed protein product [Phytomonas sp. isolate Hart1]